MIYFHRAPIKAAGHRFLRTNVTLIHSSMRVLKFYIFGLLACSVGAIKIDVTINGSHVKNILTGSDVILNCSVPRGDAVDRFDWLKGNQSVPDHVVTTSFQGGVWWSSLVLQNVSPLNTTAIYTCRTWKNNSTKATLQRYVCVDEIVLQVKPNFLFMDAGDSKVIPCTVQASCEIPSLQWLDQSRNIINENAKIERTSRTELKLKLSEVKLKDAGMYYCRAINSAGREVKKQSFYLIVREVKFSNPPLMTSPYQQAVGNYGSNVTLSFSTKYTPRPLTHGVWKYNGRVLDDSPKYTLHESWPVPGTHQGLFSMTVHNLTEDDSGNYTLRVTTSVEPPAVGHVQLTVHGSVVRVSPPHRPSHSSAPATSRIVTCEMEFPDMDPLPPRFYWALNGETLTSQSKYKKQLLQEHRGHSIFMTMVLTIFNYSQSDCRWYTCGMDTSQGVKEKLVAPCPMNKTDPQATSDQKTASRKSLVWIPITLGGVFLLVVMVIGFTWLFVKRHEKIKSYVFYQGFGRKKGQEAQEVHVHSYQNEHELHSNPL